MISYNYQIPQTPAIATSGYRVAPQVKSEQPSSSFLPTDGAVLGQSLNWAGTQPSQAPSILPPSSPESTVKSAPVSTDMIFFDLSGHDLLRSGSRAS